MASILVIGYGNPLRADDGVGPHVVEKLREECEGRVAGALFLTPHQLSPEVSAEVSESTFVLFVDAGTEGTPGEVRAREVRPELVDPPASFSHHMSPEAVLWTAKTLYGQAPRAVLLTITGADFGLGDQFSPEVQVGMPALIARALRLLEGRLSTNSTNEHK